MASSTSASDLSGCWAISARRYSSASDSASWRSAGSSFASASPRAFRYWSMERGALLLMAGIPEKSLVEIVAVRPVRIAGGSRRECAGLDENVDESTGFAPDRLPGFERGPSQVCNSVVAPGRSRIRRYHAAREQPVRAHRPQHRVEHALLQSHGGGDLLQLLGNLVAVEIVVGLVQDGEEHQSSQARIQFLLELAGEAVLSRL